MGSFSTVDNSLRLIQNIMKDNKLHFCHDFLKRKKIQRLLLVAVQSIDERKVNRTIHMTFHHFSDILREMSPSNPFDVVKMLFLNDLLRSKLKPMSEITTSSFRVDGHSLDRCGSRSSQAPLAVAGQAQLVSQ